MPTLESVRRIVGSGIIQKYVTDDEGGGGGDSMIKVGNFTSDNNEQPINTGFKPKVLLTVGEGDLYLFTEFGFYNIFDYDIQDYNDRTRTVTAQTLRPTNPSPRCIFNDTGFTVRLIASDWFYIALG